MKTLQNIFHHFTRPADWIGFTVLVVSFVFLGGLADRAQAGGGTPDCSDSLSETLYTYHCEDAVYRGGLSGSRTISIPYYDRLTAVSGTAWSAGYYASYSPTVGSWGNLLPFVSNGTLTISWSSGVPPGYENSAISWTVYFYLRPRPIATSCTANPSTIDANQATTLSATGSDPAGGVITQYAWNFGDGTTAVTDASPPDVRLTGPPAKPDVPPLAQGLGVPLAQATHIYGLPHAEPAPPISMSASPSSLLKGQSATISWSVDSAATNTYWLRYTAQSGASVEKSVTLPFGSSNVYGRSTTNINDLFPAFTGALAVDLVAVVETSFGWAKLYQEVQQITQGQSVKLYYRMYDPALNWWDFGQSVGTVASNFGAAWAYFNLGDATVTPSSLTIASNFYPGTPPKSGSYTFTPTIGTTYYLEASDYLGAGGTLRTNRANVPLTITPAPATHTYSQAGIYTVTVTATSTTGNTGTASCQVTVKSPYPPPIVTLSASPTTIGRGRSSNLTWTTQYATSLTIDQGIGAVSPVSSGSRSVAPIMSTTYTATAIGPGGTRTATVTITVIPPPIVTLAADQTLIPAGSSTTLRWSSQNATTLAIDQGIGAVTPVAGGQRSINPAATTTYTATASGQYDTITASVTVTVFGAPSAATMSGLAACADSAYTGQGKISWSGTPNPSFGFYVDIDDDPNFGSYSNKQVTSGTSTDTSNFRGIYPATDQVLVLNPHTTYYVRVYNGNHSSTSSFRVPYCLPTVDVKGRTETGSPSDGPLTVDYNHPIILTWTSEHTTGCTASAGTPSWPGAKATNNAAGESSGNITRNLTFTLTCANAIGQTSNDSVSVIVRLDFGSVSVVGDIFSGTNVLGISVDPKSVVSAAGTIDILGTNLKLPGYTPAPHNSWERLRTLMVANITRLRAERAVTLAANNGPGVAIPAPGSSTRFFNLNPLTGDPYNGDHGINPNHPEGGVWYVAGDLELTAPLVIIHRGTIIVEGAIHLLGSPDGALSVGQGGTLGLVALGPGGITIDPSLKELHGVAFFAANGPIIFSR